MTLTAPPPKLERTLESCEAAAEELSALGVERAHSEPEPLRVKSIRRRRLGRLAYEKLTFEHDRRCRSRWPPRASAVRRRRWSPLPDRRRPRPWLVWVHGAGQGQPIDLLFSRARRIRDELGFNIALPVQPGHGSRRTAWPPYPNMDPLTNVAGMMRVVSEVRALVRWLRPQSTVIAVSGVSMGSPVAALVSHFEEVDGVAVYTPILGLNAMIAQHLGRWGPSVTTPSSCWGPTRWQRWRPRSITRRRADAAPQAASSSAPGTTGWRCASPLRCCTSGGAASCTGTTGSHVGHLFAGGVQTGVGEVPRCDDRWDRDGCECRRSVRHRRADSLSG